MAHVFKRPLKLDTRLSEQPRQLAEEFLGNAVHHARLDLVVATMCPLSPLGRAVIISTCTKDLEGSAKGSEPPKGRCVSGRMEHHVA